jgi:hypothetical protein
MNIHILSKHSENILDPPFPESPTVSLSLTIHVRLAKLVISLK